MEHHPGTQRGDGCRASFRSCDVPKVRILTDRRKARDALTASNRSTIRGDCTRAQHYRRSAEAGNRDHLTGDEFTSWKQPHRPEAGPSPMTTTHDYHGQRHELRNSLGRAADPAGATGGTETGKETPP